MKFDSRALDNAFNLSPLDLQVFLPCMAGLLFFVGGIVVGRTFPTTVSISAHPPEVVMTKAHGRYGAPRWIQQQKTLVADGAQQF